MGFSLFSCSNKYFKSRKITEAIVQLFDVSNNIVSIVFRLRKGSFVDWFDYKRRTNSTGTVIKKEKKSKWHRIIPDWWRGFIWAVIRTTGKCEINQTQNYFAFYTFVGGVMSLKVLLNYKKPFSCWPLFHLLPLTLNMCVGQKLSQKQMRGIKISFIFNYGYI